MRGKDFRTASVGATPRITPAYAGKSIIHKKSVYSMWDHPRLCGEKFAVVNNQIVPLGSPPPMRGKVPQFYFSQTVYRITPAYAGKSYKLALRASWNWDHPRLCGEKSIS